MSLKDNARDWLKKVVGNHVGKNIRRYEFAMYLGEVRHNSLGGIGYLQPIEGTVVDASDGPHGCPVRLRRRELEQQFLALPWAQVRDGVQVKRLSTEEDGYVLARSDARVHKERGMRRRRLRRYVERLQALQGQSLTRDQLLMKLGAAKHDAGRAANLVRISLPVASTTTASFEFRLDRAKLRQTRRREGRYLLRTNLQGHDPAQLWTFYIQLTEVEQAFKELKHDLSIRPIYHHDPGRIEAHVFVAFLAYCLQVTLKARLRPAASGITPREVITKFKSMQMVDVHLPTADGRELVLSRYTQPEPEHRMLLDQLHLALPEQPPPKITSRQLDSPAPAASV